MKSKVLRSKLEQLKDLKIGEPMLILNMNGDNENFKMFTLIDDLSLPSAIVIHPDGEANIICHEMEQSMLDPFSDRVTTYESSSDLFSRLKQIIPEGSELLIEISDDSRLDKITVGVYNRLKDTYKLGSAEDILFKLRSFKTEIELENVKEAVRMTQAILDSVEENVTLGMREKDILVELLGMTRDLNLAFKPIVASGERTKHPHVRCTNRRIKRGDVVIIDFGVVYNCYTADITRSYLVGGEIEDLDLYRASTDFISKFENMRVDTDSRTIAEELDRFAEELDVKKYVRHAYGHGIGVDVHDIFPTISTSLKKWSDENIHDNVTLAFEPGFYTNEYGIRIENDYVVKDKKPNRL